MAMGMGQVTHTRAHTHSVGGMGSQSRGYYLAHLANKKVQMRMKSSMVATITERHGEWKRAGGNHPSKF